MLLTRLVFSGNEWIEVSLPAGYDPNWTEQDTYFYAVVWGLAFRKGFSQQKTSQLAEAAVFKRVYPGIQFFDSLEKDLESLQNEI
jgi:hypothetical protein